ncbi:hypothetical protein K466DRAFT_337005 [Polyporus arcularius HHB13444]|uniref:Uncharacterized protein n=1 Tax=Polyporus arcularius HHB13444 TaxID=1314778 RepID=A0A5C3NYP3_9APHY|nr:hypothetical protein K466DRAFT_337005 [Polyporus arcularius HHB13444]
MDTGKRRARTERVQSKVHTFNTMAYSGGGRAVVSAATSSKQRKSSEGEGKIWGMDDEVSKTRRLSALSPRTFPRAGTCFVKHTPRNHWQSPSQSSLHMQSLRSEQGQRSSVVLAPTRAASCPASTCSVRGSKFAHDVLDPRSEQRASRSQVGVASTSRERPHFPLCKPRPLAGIVAPGIAVSAPIACLGRARWRTPSDRGFAARFTTNTSGSGRRAYTTVPVRWDCSPLSDQSHEHRPCPCPAGWGEGC